MHMEPHKAKSSRHSECLHDMSRPCVVAVGAVASLLVCHTKSSGSIQRLQVCPLHGVSHVLTSSVPQAPTLMVSLEY